ncbi:MAG: hypothetical protein AAGJ79_03525 [Verrucomicrobiota bacterium]
MKRGLFRDIESPRLLCLKGVGFLVIGLLSSLLLLLMCPNWKVALLLILVIWSFCRAYYFAFYVIEKYIDEDFKFAGLFSVIRFLARRNRG